MNLRTRILAELAELGQATSVQIAPRIGVPPQRVTQALFEARKRGVVKEVARKHGGGRMLVVWAPGDTPRVRVYDFSALMRHWPYCGRVTKEWA